jgi:hypothetical protein
MFDFLRKSNQAQKPSEALLQALQASDLPPGTEASKLGVAESTGRYSGRKVTFFRVFDPAGAAKRSINVTSRRAYGDLDANLDLVVRSGHIEEDGTIVLSTQVAAVDRQTPTRERADAAHRPGA